MRKELLGLLLIGGLAGCTSQWDTDRAEASRSSSAAKAESAQAPAKLVAERGPQRSFASLPDRGELLQYAKDRKARKSGAYTYHPVAISEAHALNAIAKGGMRINMPDGKTLDLKYDRYEEQPDGNWTWIGRNADGSEAVLTFGDKAVFGMIASGGQSYQVRTDPAGAWVIETNPSLLAPGGGHIRRKAGPDYLEPPSTSIATAMAASQKQAIASGAKVAVADEKALAVIDVLLGYSNGLVDRVGSESGVQTLMASRIALTNAAYQASGVVMRVRLVHSMLVNYSDTAVKNDATLRKLTGYDDTTQQNIPVDPAFNALRSAREQYGADLVALVRQYRNVQDGCGIAWLIGMNQRAITTAADAPFGYAVVGDGSDLEGANNYRCGDYALAHELGHLMGQAHNSEDSVNQNGPYTGAHSYSFGYRESASTGFFTLMAYPRDDTQAANEIPYFANPAISVSGRPTGTANADNVRSMNQTMPIIANFRSTVVPLVVPPRNDLNLDGRSDLLWHRPHAGRGGYWTMNGASRLASNEFAIAMGYSLATSADFNGDGRVDLAWTSAAGDLWLWPSNGSGGFGSAKIADYSGGWQVAGSGDIDGDGKADLIWHNPSTNRTGYWIMSGASVVRTQEFAIAAGYRIAAIGDLNADGRDDIVWTSNSRDLWLWSSNVSGSFDSAWIANYAGGWQVVGAGDINGNGSSDLIWHNATTNRTGYWLMNGASVSSSREFAVGAGYRVAAIGDFNGDGRADLMWTSSAGDLWLWPSESSGNYGSQFVTYYGDGWQVVGLK